MSKIIQINANFSCTPGTKHELVSPTHCKCTKGTLYVQAAGATGEAAAKGSLVVVMIDGGKAVQTHAGGKVQCVPGVQGELEKLPEPTPKAPRDTGASRHSGSHNNSALTKVLSERRG